MRKPARPKPHAKLEMSDSLSKFLDAMKRSRLFSKTESQKLFQGLDAKDPNVVQQLKERLVSQAKLTPFQMSWLQNPTDTPLVLGDYVLVGSIGGGGMGDVFRAMHRTMHRHVALKVLKDPSLQTDEALARFQREVRAAARLEHENVVTAYDAGEDQGVHFLVMQLVEGSDLATLVRLNGPLSVFHAIGYLLEACRGMAYAHNQGVIHRDLKPANLLVDQSGRVKVLDLGLARFALEEAEPIAQQQDLMTEVGSILGTVDYMAPEQAMDSRTADERSDIYSLGCTFYRLLTGGRMYEGDTIMKRIMAHREAPIPSLRSVRNDVSMEVDAIFQKMVAKNPADRFASMQDVVATLQPHFNANEETAALVDGDATALISSQTIGRDDVQETTALHRNDLDTSPIPISESATVAGRYRNRNKSNGLPMVVVILLALGVVGIAGVALAAGFAYWLNTDTVVATAPPEKPSENQVRSDNRRDKQPVESAQPKHKYPAVKDNLDSIIDSVRYKNESRNLYTEIATCLDENWEGRWWIGSGKTISGEAYEISTATGKFESKTMKTSEAAAIELNVKEVRNELPKGYVDPAKYHIELITLQSQLSTFGDQSKKFTVLFDYKGEIPDTTRQLMACLRGYSTTGVQLNYLVHFATPGLRPAPMELTFKIGPEIDFKRGAKVFLVGLLEKPDIRFWRISNEITVVSEGFEETAAVGADLLEIENKLQAIFTEAAPRSRAILSFEIAAALQQKIQCRWLIFGGNSGDGKPWNIVAADGKWLVKHEGNPTPEQASGRGAARFGDPIVDLPEHQLYEISLAEISQNEDNDLVGKLQWRRLKQQPTARVALIYRVKSNREEDLEYTDLYQFLPSETPKSEFIELKLPSPGAEPLPGSEMFLVGLTQAKDSDEVYFHRISNRLFKPAKE